jgi:hypothetical protein
MNAQTCPVCQKECLSEGQYFTHLAFDHGAYNVYASANSLERDFRHNYDNCIELMLEEIARKALAG